MNSRLTKENERAYQFFKKNTPLSRNNYRYTYIEEVDKIDLYNLLEFEIIKRRLIPIQNIIDYDDYTYLKIKEIDEALIEEQNMFRMINVFTNLDNLIISLKYKISLFKSLKKGSNTGKFLQHKIADFLFIYDCFCWGLKNEFVFYGLSDYYEKTAKSTNIKTLRMYKKLVLNVYKEPTQRTIQIFEALYNKESTIKFHNSKL